MQWPVHLLQHVTSALCDMHALQMPYCTRCKSGNLWMSLWLRGFTVRYDPSVSTFAHAVACTTAAACAMCDLQILCQTQCKIGTLWVAVQLRGLSVRCDPTVPNFSCEVPKTDEACFAAWSMHEVQMPCWTWNGGKLCMTPQHGGLTASMTPQCLFLHIQ